MASAPPGRHLRSLLAPPYVCVEYDKLAPNLMLDWETDFDAGFHRENVMTAILLRDYQALVLCIVGRPCKRAWKSIHSLIVLNTRISTWELCPMPIPDFTRDRSCGYTHARPVPWPAMAMSIHHRLEDKTNSSTTDVFLDLAIISSWDITTLRSTVEQAPHFSGCVGCNPRLHRPSLRNIPLPTVDKPGAYRHGNFR